MHEMAIAQSLMDIIRREMEKNGASTLHSVTIRAGELNAVVPQALETAFRALTEKTSLQGARLKIETVPLELECGSCGKRFTSGGDDMAFLSAECPGCGMELGHRILAGRELYVQSLEAE